MIQLLSVYTHSPAPTTLRSTGGEGIGWLSSPAVLAATQAGRQWCACDWIPADSQWRIQEHSLWSNHLKGTNTHVHVWTLA